MIGMYAEPKPKGFGFSDTAFRIFILMASRRLESDRFFTRDYRPEVYTQEGIDWVEDNTMRTLLLRHFPELEPRAARRREPVRALAAAAQAQRDRARPRHPQPRPREGRPRARVPDRRRRRADASSTRCSRATRRLVLEAIRGLGRKRDRPEAHRDHARPPLAPRRPRGAEARERRDRLRAPRGRRTSSPATAARNRSASCRSSRSG